MFRASELHLYILIHSIFIGQVLLLHFNSLEWVLFIKIAICSLSHGWPEEHGDC